MRIVILMVIFVCTTLAGEINVNSDSIIFNKLNKLSLIGDFDGDGVRDTLFEHNYSKQTNSEIDSCPDIMKNEWEAVEKWFRDKDAELILTFGKQIKDTLNLGFAYNLYCLINLGDLNSDGKDEIALVINYLDFSSLNSCKIYTICNNKWQIIKSFQIHEDAFEIYKNNINAKFNSIKYYLQKRNGKWYYKDLFQEDTEDNWNGEMKQLILEKCK